MRIIGGNYKGTKIFLPQDNSTRPLKDLVRQSIFNILEHSKLESVNLKKSYVLDLFSGIGSFGLECISRGVKKVCFVENYEPSIKILNKNIEKLNCKINTNVFGGDVSQIEKIDYILNKKFNLIYLDPPFKEKYICKIIEKIHKLKLLQPKGLIIIHRHKKTNDRFINKFKILRTEKYGASKIIFAKFI
tara:strand:- start:3106 stop:3672 length:567 start_codon:yes stop_codon:yes gene_type:complete